MAAIPKIKSYEDYDVLQGVNEASRETWKTSTFMDSTMNGDDAIFKIKANVMEASGSELEADAKFTATPSDNEENANTKKEAVSAGAIVGLPMSSAQNTPRK